MLSLLPTTSHFSISFFLLACVLQQCTDLHCPCPFIGQLLSFTLPSCPGLNANTHQSLLFIVSNQFSNCLLVTLIKEVPLPRLSITAECHPCKVDTFKPWPPAPTGRRRFYSVRNVICSLPKEGTLTYLLRQQPCPPHHHLHSASSMRPRNPVNFT